MGFRRIAPIMCLAALGVGILAGCGQGDPDAGAPASTPAAAPSTSAPSSPAPTSATTPSTATATASPTAEQSIEGIDASHHQGPIAWAKVADAGIGFAYLKASEGTGFTDPRFAGHRRAAAQHGIAVSGYHYFQLCSDGASQAQHFLEVLGPVNRKQDGGLAPALDLELAGSCADPPPADVLLAEVREFLTAVDRRTGTPTLVYLYPDFEDRFGFADDLADHPQWVRRLGKQAPRRDWQVWQYDDAGTVPGIAGGVDRNRMSPATR